MDEAKKANMIQRFITGAGLTALVMVLMYFGGAVMGIAICICAGLAVHEEYKALAAVHNIVFWPAWVGLALGVPLTLILGARVILTVLMGIFLVIALVILRRKEPKLTDLIMSLLPLVTIALPALCAVSVCLVRPKGLQVVLLTLLFSVPVLCDTFAYFIGSAVGGPKLCPSVSPKKTIAGAIAGMIGAVLTAVVVCIVANIALDEATRALIPTWWGFILLGLIGGVASQVGDLFASMVKRYCGIKDFSNIFPGHGGMLDRLDSVLFMAVVIFCYRLFILAV